MTLIEILEKNKHHKGKTVFIGCSNFDITEVVYSNMIESNIQRRDVDFFMPKNTRGWQRWNDISVSIINDFSKESSFNKVNNILEQDYSKLGNIGILIIEAPSPQGAIDLIHKAKSQMKKSGLIIISYKESKNKSYQQIISKEFDSQDFGHMNKFSYINYIQGKTPLNRFKKVGRTRSIMT
jgi:hypothetical protein